MENLVSVPNPKHKLCSPLQLKFDPRPTFWAMTQLIVAVNLRRVRHQIPSPGFVDSRVGIPS